MHSDEQPLFKPLLEPSSHSSLEATRPSPHTEVHVDLGYPVQVNPNSSVQVLLQPSPEFTLPSSQASVPAMIASPHYVEQDEGLFPVQ